MKKLPVVLALPMCLGLTLAQDTRTTATGSNGQSWVGILVDSKCASPRSAATRQTTATEGRDFNTTDRNTTGVADRTATSSVSRDDIAPRSSATDRADTRTRATNSTEMAPTTGSGELSRATGAMGAARGADTQIGNNPSGNLNSMGDVATEKSAGNWDRSCFISPGSSSFVLQLQDGRTLKIDDAGNSRISSQLHSTGRVSKSAKVFRVKITGTVDGDTLHLTGIQI